MLRQSLLLASVLLFLISSAQPTTYTYKTVNNLDIQADVYLPNITSSTLYPVIFAIHGGGYVAGTKWDAVSPQQLQEMLKRGWAVVSIDYRLNPGAFIEDIVQDVQDAYNWIRNDLSKIVSINPDSIIVWGKSAGGGLAVISGYKLSPRPRAVLAFYPYCTNFTGPYAYNPGTPVPQSLVEVANNFTQPTSEYNATGFNDPRIVLFFTALSEQKGGWLLATSDPNKPTDQILAILNQYSTVENIDANYPPTYLIHGLADVLVPYEQSVEMATVLKEKNVTYQIVLVPDANHGFDIVNSTEEVWEEYILPMFNFADQYMLNNTEIDKIEN